MKNIDKALDIGCGRAEWVELLQKNQIDAFGIDMNHAMVEEAHRNGVKNIQNIDLFKYLKNLQDNSFDLITAFHIIEHIPFENLMIFFKEIRRVLKSGGQIMLETPNPENLLVSSLTFYKDPTHLNPLPAEVVEFMINYFGFLDIKIVYLNPFPKEMCIDEKTKSSEVLNKLLFKEQDYMVIANK